MAARTRSTQSKFGAERARQHIATRFNPIRGLTPAKLSRELDAFNAGQLRQCAVLWQAIAERDDQVITCTGKRARKVTGLNWEILPRDDSPEAAKHKEVLEAFYANLTAVNALDENQRGGLNTLLRHMHSAVGMRYAAHEIVWQPDAPGGLTAEFRFLPLQFFENTTGRLRFLVTDHDPYGVALDEHFGEGGWMVTAGEGLMFASSVAYMFKTMPLKSAVGYAEKFGTPPLHGKTSAAKGSPEWIAMRDALIGFGEDLAILTNLDAQISPIELKSAGNAPHLPLVDRMDRALSRIWLGGDLATMSKDGGAVGSQPQNDDLDDLIAADCDMLNGALRYYVDRWVIRYTFGDVPPLAYFELQPPAEIDTDRELKVDEFLIKHGVPRGKKDLLERYGRPEPDAQDELASAPAAPAPFGPGAPGKPPPPAGQPEPTPAANEAARHGRYELFLGEAAARYAQAQRNALAPLLNRLAEIGAIADPAQLQAELAGFRAALPELRRQVIRQAPEAARPLEEAIGTAVISGFAEAARKTAQPAQKP